MNAIKSRQISELRRIGKFRQMMQKLQGQPLTPTEERQAYLKLLQAFKLLQAQRREPMSFDEFESARHTSNSFKLRQ